MNDADTLENAMSTITDIPTHALLEGDLILDGASTVSVDAVKPDAMDDDVCWISATCCSGNFENYDAPIRAGVDATWQVLNASAR